MSNSVRRFRIGYADGCFTLSPCEDQSNLVLGTMILIGAAEGDTLIPCFDEAELARRNLTVLRTVEQKET
jgi:hypothetical protein